MLTSLGQGAAIAIEDAAVLAHCLATIDDPQAALRAYENRRRDRARAMVETSRALSRIEQLSIRCAPSPAISTSASLRSEPSPGRTNWH